ncbi:BspA family leucine-rich repeat surface protein [Cellulophaga sp. HaHaR_3_176]|uniref:BspA family leucine-rich repeat surface protein n=1 Tax=Cellulophaga sp. HaHaR_3_176 TaxID=1942464 RepID=UPI001C2010B5|nr:BspA family leucine-rich repeat surface protein [Cellulophaga sp. HaHaR_3_176]QWX83192.1 BspA family leucine-rich repeat surface protein [Cellulophaga sp. HaHaR_3_176]
MIKKSITLLLLFISINLFSQEFTTIWNTNNTESGSSANNQITIPTNPAYTTYNYNVDWGDTTSDSNVTGNITHTYAIPGTYTISISGTFPAIYFNDENANDKLKIIEILSWGTIQWQTMENAFFGCENLNFDAIDSPNLSQVTSLKNMFRECKSFNGIVNSWDVSTITDMSGLFASASAFNRPLNDWITNAVTDMSSLFERTRFNEPLNRWNTDAVTNMANMFNSATAFNQDIENWNVANVTNMQGMFAIALTYNRPLEDWNVANVTDMNLMFFRAREFNQPLGRWDVGNVTNMSRMFDGFLPMIFDQPLNSWNVSQVTDMSSMFRRCQTFNQPLASWVVSNVTNMSKMFESAILFNQPIDDWDVSNVNDMSGMFWGENSSVTMAFNQPLNSWNVGSVTDMSDMFRDCIVFDQPLTTWNVAMVTDMSGMFSNATAFNQPINIWNTTSLTDASSMFLNASQFNQTLENWNVSNVTTTDGMFTSANAFDQSLATWDVTGITTMAQMLNNTSLSQENYDNTLLSWSAQNVETNVPLGANTLNYCDSRDARQALIDLQNWTITGDNVNCSFVLCTEIISPFNGDTNVPANSDIRWNPAPNADGYNITLEIIRGGTRSFIDINGAPADNLDIGNIVGVSFTNEFLPGDTVFVTVVPYNTEGSAVGCQETQFTTIESWVNSPDAFKFTIDTRILDGNSSAVNQLFLETNSSYTYDFSIDWGDNRYDNNVSGQLTHNYLSPGEYTISIIGTYPHHLYRSTNRDNKKLISVDQWGTQPWLDMSYTFWFCDNMVYNAMDVPDLSNVTNMSRMFRRNGLFNGNINNWDVSNVTNMNNMFYQAEIFNQPLNDWDVSSVTTMVNMFETAIAFNQPLNEWDVSNVTNMNTMFIRCDAFNQPLNDWDVSSVTSMKQMFSYTDAFDQPLNDWDVGNVITMEQMFERALSFDGNISDWDVSNVTDISGMFDNAQTFNQPLNWDVSNVEDMSQTFQGTRLFNQPLNSWDVSNVVRMDYMFSSAVLFNQPLNTWNVSSVTNMRSMFNSAAVFNQNINSWNVTNVLSMESMFESAVLFDEPLNMWEVNSVVNMASMFESAQVFNQPIGSWDVSAVANMSSMFKDAQVFNQPLANWNVSSVTLMPFMFEDAREFNRVINNWDVSSVTNMEAMFRNADIFNEPLNNWDTRESLTTASMFQGATVFNQNIDTWETSFVRTMEAMFNDAIAYDQPMNSWNVASVTTMEDMFKNAASFNSDISAWNVRGVTTMEEMFSNATAFNQNLNNWRVSGVNNMDYMFREAFAYNQPMDLWNLGNLSMRSTFYNATALNQYLGDWDVTGVSNMSDILDNTALIRENYDNTLIAWSEQNLTPGITIGVQDLPYCSAQEERQSMIDNFGWTFDQDVRDCPIPECTQLASPLNGDTDIPVNTNITWDAALFAQGYRLTVGTSSGGNDIVDNATITNETSYEFAADFNTGDTVFVTIIPFNDEGDAIGPCTEESFTISNTAATIPECTILTAPLHGATDVAVTTDLSWNPISNADAFKITVGTSSGANDILDAEDVGNVNTFDFTSDLPEDSDIFVTIVPYNDEGDAASCTEEIFHTEIIPVPPTCTNLTTPINRATDVPIDTQLSWAAVTNATGYLVVVGTTSGGIEVVNNADVIGATTYDIPGDLQESRLHYVTIIPYNDEGDATGCIEETFTTGDSTSPPSCGILSAPVDGATQVALDTNLSWNGSDSADGYRLTVGTTSGGSDIFTDDLGDVTTYDLASDLPENETIFVSIIAYNINGSSSGCAEYTFETAGPPECTTLISPSNNDNDIAVDTSIEWNAVANADGYKVTVIGSNSTANNMTDFEVTSGTTFDFANDFIQGETVTVTIIPFNGSVNANGCINESFTIETAVGPTTPACTTLTNPFNGATDVAIGTTQMTWDNVTDATGYRITVSGTANNNVTDLEVTTNSYNFTNTFVNDETAIVTIIPFNGSVNANGCINESFTIETAAVPTTPTCTTLTSPLNGATDVALSTTQMTWNNMTDATGYRITISGTANNNVTDVEVTSNSYNFPNAFVNDETAIVTIIPFNGSVDANGCSNESFTIETAVRPTTPACTTLTSPLNGATDVAVNPAYISWRAINNADGYLLTVGTTPRGNNILDRQDVGLLTEYSFLQDFPNKSTIYVTIISYNSQGDSGICEEETFTTIGEEIVDETKYGFSPNSDGINDYWHIDHIEEYPTNIVTIYNRWGDTVFKIENYDNISNVFRGNANQKTKMGAGRLPSGTYFFNIQIDGESILKKTKGYVILKR